MRRDEAVIIEAALTGETSKGMNPNTPRTPAEIASDALECIAAGAAIIHSHCDLRLTGAESADAYIESWRPVMAAHPDTIFCPTSTLATDLDEKWRHLEILAQHGVAMGPLDPGSLNMANSDAEGLPGAYAAVHVNGHPEIRHVMGLMGRIGMGPSLGIYEPGFLRTVLAYERAGRLPAGALIKLYFGGPYNWFDGTRTGTGFGLPPTRAAFEAYADMLEESQTPWAVAVVGGDVIETGIARLALERGGHLRVGLEDFLGETLPRNQQLVAAAADLCREVGRPIASAHDARAILNLPQASPAI